MKDNKRKFAINLIEFYKDSLCNSASSINKLAQLQKKFPKEYEVFKQASLDPTILPTILEKLDDESRGILVDIYFKQDVLSKKAHLLFQMGVKEKEEYAKQLADFGKLVDEKLKKLMEKEGKK
jgi:hypothetical protein